MMTILSALAAAFSGTGDWAALLLPVAVIGVASSWIEAILPLYAIDAGTLTPSGVGLLFSWAGILGALFQLPIVRANWPGCGGPSSSPSAGQFWSWRLAHCSLRRRCHASSAPSPWWLSPRCSSGPLTQGIVTELAPQHGRATYMAAFSSVHDMRDAAGPAIGTALYAAGSMLPWLVGRAGDTRCVVYAGAGSPSPRDEVAHSRSRE